MAQYRTGIIACGIIARVHARGWLGVPGTPTDIGALADTNADARREFGDFFDVPQGSRYADYREMLDKEDLDFVDICSWHQQHAEMVIAAAARQPKAILCQKPMAVDLAEADAMLTACERNNVKLIIAYQRPHHAAWLKARDLIREGVIGDVLQVQLDCGGNILNTNSHNIRLALMLMDEPEVEWVMGAAERTTDRRERGLPAEDATLGVAGCSNGAQLLILGNLNERPGRLRRPGQGRHPDKARRSLGQGCRVIGSEGIMELTTTRHPD
jgi:UDP-N-acetyl-2-amino-2-deoxyglucuronate dehydrogenase